MLASSFLLFKQRSSDLQIMSISQLGRVAAFRGIRVRISTGDYLPSDGEISVVLDIITQLSYALLALVLERSKIVSIT